MTVTGQRQTVWAGCGGCLFARCFQVVSGKDCCLQEACLVGSAAGT